MQTPDFAIIGGSGFYELIEQTREATMLTPYGLTSEEIIVGTFHGKTCAFLPRHGKDHQLPPHKVPYMANMYALAELGVTQVIAMTAVGALTNNHQTGDIVIADQLVDFTQGTRQDTFFDGPEVTHIGFAEPYCRQMRATAIAAANEQKLKIASTGTIVVTAGPRFSTKAESQFFANQGWELENMTQYPEAILARELAMSYLNISLVTNSVIKANEAIAPGIEAADEAVDVLEKRLDVLIGLVGRFVELQPKGDNRPDAIRNAKANGRWVR